MRQIQCKTTDEYLMTLQEDERKIMQTIRDTIKKAVPQAKEVISYQMPAFKCYGVLVYYAYCKTHIGFYPTPSGIEAFKSELAGYDCSKGTVRFPLDKPLPLKLIRDIALFRYHEDLGKGKAHKT